MEVWISSEENGEGRWRGEERVMRASDICGYPQAEEDQNPTSLNAIEECSDGVESGRFEFHGGRKLMCNDPRQSISETEFETRAETERKQRDPDSWSRGTVHLFET
jgi:hypothetical protein